jgi:hypothetical protein
MAADSRQYLGEQMALFQGGYEHIQFQLTGHMRGSDDLVTIGLRLQDHATGDLIAYEVPTLRGDLNHLGELGGDIARLLQFIHGELSPF